MSVLDGLRRAGVPESIAAAEAPRASAAMLEAHITTQPRASMFLAQVLHESAGLRYFEEIASGAAYEWRRDLGNVLPGDGVRFKGRGPIQLTGRANYRMAGAALGLPLEANPGLAARHDVGWRIAAWYWSTRGLNTLADRGDFLGITKRINGGYNGLAARQHYLARLRDVDVRPIVPGPASWLTDVELRRVRELDGIRNGTIKPSHASREEVLVLALTRQRKQIWHAATNDPAGAKAGWARMHRRERYASLLARTK